jgi:ribonuclease HII
MLKVCLKENRIEAGCDEAGRGCLAGPVFAASVILPPTFYHPLINDSKQLSHKQRLLLKEVVEENAMAFAVEMVLPLEIDQINILNASIMAMHRAVKKLVIQPNFLLIDGNRFKDYPGIPHQCIVKGDSKFMSIAAASILAKTYRDKYMTELSSNFPNYSWEKNKGYPTLEHRKAIDIHGITPHHRRSFKLTNSQLEIPFSGIDQYD